MNGEVEEEEEEEDLWDDPTPPSTTQQSPGVAPCDEGRTEAHPPNGPSDDKDPRTKGGASDNSPQMSLPVDRVSDIHHSTVIDSNPVNRHFTSLNGGDSSGTAAAGNVDGGGESSSSPRGGEEFGLLTVEAIEADAKRSNGNDLIDFHQLDFEAESLVAGLLEGTPAKGEQERTTAINAAHNVGLLTGVNAVNVAAAAAFANVERERLKLVTSQTLDANKWFYRDPQGEVQGL